MKSVKGVKWFNSKDNVLDITTVLVEMLTAAINTLGESDRYEVKMIVSKPDGREKCGWTRKITV